MTLDQLPKDHQARIVSIQDGEENGILINLGVDVGSIVEMVWPSIWQRPMVIRYGENQLVAIRGDVARRIEVKEVSNAES